MIFFPGWCPFAVTLLHPRGIICVAFPTESYLNVSPSCVEELLIANNVMNHEVESRVNDTNS